MVKIVRTPAAARDWFSAERLSGMHPLCMSYYPPSGDGPAKPKRKRKRKAQKPLQKAEPLPEREAQPVSIGKSLLK